MYLREHPEESSRIRKAARRSARQFTWDAAARNLIQKLENQARMQHIIGGYAEREPMAPFRIEEHANESLPGTTGPSNPPMSNL
jgi:hypothetical protein